MSCAFSGIFVQVRLEMVFAGWEQYCHLFCLFRMQLFLVFFLRKYMCSVIAACKTSWQHAPEYKSTGASRGRRSSLRLFRKGCVLSGYSLWLYILTWSLAPYREWVFSRVLEDMWPHPANPVRYKGLLFSLYQCCFFRCWVFSVASHFLTSQREPLTLSPLSYSRNIKLCF